MQIMKTQQQQQHCQHRRLLPNQHLPLERPKRKLQQPHQHLLHETPPQEEVTLNMASPPQHHQLKQQQSQKLYHQLQLRTQQRHNRCRTLMSSFIVVVLLVLAFVISPAHAERDDRGPKRRKIPMFELIVGPTPKILTWTEAEQVQRTTEVVLANFLYQFFAPAPSVLSKLSASGQETTSTAPTNQRTSSAQTFVQHVSLLRVESVELLQAQIADYGDTTANDKEQVQVDMGGGWPVTSIVISGGLIYFTDDSVDVPDEDNIVRLIQKALNEEALLMELQEHFPDFTNVMFTYVPNAEDTDAEEPTVPEDEGTDPQEPGEDSRQPDNEDLDINGLDSRPTSISANEDGAPLGIVIGGAIGGLILVATIAGTMLISRRRDVQDEIIVYKEDDETPSTADDQNSGSALSFRSRKARQGKSHSISGLQTRDSLQLASEVDSASVATGASDNVGWGRYFTPTKLPRLMTTGKSDSDTTRDTTIDGMEAGNFDEVSSASEFGHSRSVDPQIVPVQAVESFEHQQRLVFSLKKDMLASHDEVLPSWKRDSRQAKGYACALQPTDVSASSLAKSSSIRAPLSPGAKTTSTKDSSAASAEEESVEVDESTMSIGIDSSAGATEVTSLPISTYFNNPVGRVWAAATGCSTTPSNQPNAKSSADSDPSDSVCCGTGYQSDDFGLDETWDPDDNSMGDNTTADSDALFSASKEFVADERSLLSHSVRSSSYKMQRLRTPKQQQQQRQGGGAHSHEFSSTTLL